MCMISTREILRKLREIRVRKKLKQDDIAQMLSIDRTTYLRKESGHIPVTTEEWLKIAAVLGEDPAIFFTETETDGESDTSDAQEQLLVKLYSALTDEEKRDLLFSIRLMLKGVSREDVRDTLLRLYWGSP